MAVRSSLSSEIKVPSIGAFQHSDCSFKNLTAVVNFSSRRAASAVKPLRAAAESRRNDSVSPLAATAIAAPKTEEDIKEEVRIVEEDFQQLAKELENASPLEIMDKALAKFGNDIAIAFSLKFLGPPLLRLRRVFDLFDKNGDGVISIDEIKQALVLLGLDDDPVSDPDADPFDDLNTIVSAFIRPGNKGLIFEDFKALHNSLNANFFSKDLHPNEVYDEEDQVESDLSEAFKVFDSDGDGFISAIELQQVLSKLGFPEAQQELQHIQLMISSFDHNHDGLGTSSLSFMDMFEWLWKANGPSSVEQFMIFGWQLWKAQNDAIFNNIEDPPMLCVRKALDWLKEYQKALTFGLECKSPAGPGRREGVWAKSPTRFIKINVDGAFKESEDKHGIGVIARDSSGNCVLAGARTLWMDGPTEMVEAQAFMWALDLAKIHGWHKLIIEGDCQFSLRLLKALENFPSIFKP